MYCKLFILFILDSFCLDQKIGAVLILHVSSLRSDVFEKLTSVSQFSSLRSAKFSCDRMSLNKLPVFSSQLSTCEEELNGLVNEIDWALKKCKEESKTEIVILRTALSDYKKKYDSCRAKLKELVKKHEDLKVQFVSLDNNYQTQLAQLQEEVTVLRSSFQDFWLRDQQRSKDRPGGWERDDHLSLDPPTIAHLKEEASRWSERAKELEEQNVEQGQQVEQLEETVRHLKQKLHLASQQPMLDRREPPSLEDLSALAERERQRFLREEAQHQQAFASSLSAKINHFRKHLDTPTLLGS